jgi:hypothetical protein
MSEGAKPLPATYAECSDEARREVVKLENGMDTDISELSDEGLHAALLYFADVDEDPFLGRLKDEAATRESVDEDERNEGHEEERSP